MSDWKPYVVEATLQTMKLRALSVRRGYRWRISTHPTPGTPGDKKRKHGRQSIVDQVTVLLTVPEVDQLVKLADRPDPLTWTHPLLPQIDGYVEDLDIPADEKIYGYFLASFNFVQDYDSSQQSMSMTITLSPQSVKKKALGLKNDLFTNLAAVSPPNTQNGTAFTAAAADLGAAWDDVADAFDSITDPDGEGTWRDLSRALDTFTGVADTFIDAAREIEDSLEGLARDIETAPMLIRETVAQAVDALKTPAGTVATFLTQQSSDLFSMMLDAGMEINEANIVGLMEDNGINNPLAIPAGMTIAIPVGV